MGQSEITVALNVPALNVEDDMRNVLQGVIGNEAPNEPGADAGSTLFLVGEDKTNLRNCTFMRFSPDDLANGWAPGKHVTSAILEVFATTTEATALPLFATIPPNEERWAPASLSASDAGTGVLHPLSVAKADCVDFSVSDAGGVILDLGGVNFAHGYPQRRELVRSPQSVGQTFLAPSTFTLDSCNFVLSRDGSGTGNIRIRVFDVSQDDGTNDGPLEPGNTALAESDNITFNTLALSTGGLPVGTNQTFTFSGGDRITINSGQRYCFMVSVEFFGSSYTRIYYSISNPTTANGSLVLDQPFSTTYSWDGIGGSWGSIPYALRCDLPHYLEQDGTTVVGAGVPTIGQVLPFNAGNFVLGTWSALADVAPLLQAWANAAGGLAAYPEAFAVGIHTGATAGTAQREGDDARLVVSWSELQQHTVVG